MYLIFLADFNVSAMVERYQDKKIDSVEGTMYFYAPETCSDDVNEDRFDAFPLDVWALGVTTFALTFLSLPFKSENNCYTDLTEKICKAEVEFPNHIRKVSPELKTLILRMLEKDPKKRITCNELKLYKWLHYGKKWITHSK